MKLIIINGLPATGKTTLAEPLSRELQIPLISKDSIKEFLFDKLGSKDRRWSKTLGGLSYEFIYAITDTMLDEGQSIMIENAFEVAFAKPRLEHIISKHSPDVLEVYCYTSPAVRKQRFVVRNESGNRHAGHSDHENYQENTGPEPLDKYAPLELGHMLRIDTTNILDIKEIKRSIDTINLK